MALTFQGMRERTEWMMAQMQADAIEHTVEQFKKAVRHYYETCEGGAECTRLIHELEELGLDQETIIDIDFEIRDQVELEQEMDGFVSEESEVE